jgi:hypothetical protein
MFPLTQLAPVVNPAGVPRILKLTSLISVNAPLLTLTNAVEELAPEGTDHESLVVDAGIVLEIVVQLEPLFNEYSTVWFDVTPTLFQVIVSLEPGLKVSPPLGYVTSILGCSTLHVNVYSCDPMGITVPTTFRV